MNVIEINRILLTGHADRMDVFPALEKLKKLEFTFKLNFGLEELPEEGGFIAIRGARQSGKSTWLEKNVLKSHRKYGPGSTFYLNGDEIKNTDELKNQLTELITFFDPKKTIKRIFIDEITAVKDWEKAIKRLADSGRTQDVLIVTTGSKATDLRRGAEKLPGRKGKLDRNYYFFLPVSYREFHKVCGERLKDDTLFSYLVAGGSPLACSELAQHGRMPEYVITLIKDWVYGECALVKRDRSSLMAIFEILFRLGGLPIGQAKLARDSGLANNTVAAGYVEFLTDLLCIAPSYAWDLNKKILLRRKAYKVNFINLLVASSFHPAKIRTVEDYKKLTPETQGVWLEWLVAQELWRRRAKRGEEIPEQLLYWQGKQNGIDFVLDGNNFVEVKRGKVSPFEFSWFHESFPKGHLKVINALRFQAQSITGMTMENFLLDE